MVQHGLVLFQNSLAWMRIKFSSGNLMRVAEMLSQEVGDGGVVVNKFSF